MNNEQMAQKLEDIAADPMWANHVEISKKTLMEAAQLLRGPDMVWILTWTHKDSISGAVSDKRRVCRSRDAAESLADALRGSSWETDIEIVGSTLF